MIKLSTKARRTLMGYYFAASAEEALAFLMAHHGDSQVVGGGTLLMSQVHLGQSYARRLVDVSRVSTMRRIACANGYLTVGGAVSLDAIACHSLVVEACPLLAAAASSMASPALRHLATIGGNLVSAMGCSQIIAALVATDAEVEITNSTGAQRLRASALLVRPGVSKVDSTSELITGFRVPVHDRADCASAIASLPARAGEDRSPLVLALLLGRDAEGHAVEWASVILGSTTFIPSRAEALEEELTGSDLADPASADRFAELVVEEARERRALGAASDERYEDLSRLAYQVWRNAADGSRVSAQTPPDVSC